MNVLKKLHAARDVVRMVKVHRGANCSSPLIKTRGTCHFARHPMATGHYRYHAVADATTIIVIIITTVARVSIDTESTAFSLSLFFALHPRSLKTRALDPESITARDSRVTSDLRSSFPRAGNSLGQSLGFERWATARTALQPPKIMLTSPASVSSLITACRDSLSARVLR